jgi:subtilisin family serine protease
VSLDAPIGSHATTTATETALRTTLALPNAEFAGSVGSGVGVAVIDSGIVPNYDLLPSRIRAFRDFTTGQGAVETAPTDGYGHGTHVASLIGGTGEMSRYKKYQGVAPDVAFMVSAWWTKRRRADQPGDRGRRVGRD